MNQYPQPSHTFIRREIAALEAAGHAVERFTVRNWPGRLVDPADIEERARTRAVLGVGTTGLLLSVLFGMVTRPLRFWGAMKMACRLGWRGDRGLLYHAIYLAEACVLLRWWRRSRIEHVHVHFGTNGTAVALLCRLLGGPTYSFTVHGPEEFDRPIGLRLGEKIAHARFVVAISHFGRSQLLRWCASATGTRCTWYVAVWIRCI